MTAALTVTSLEAGYEPGLPILRGASLRVTAGDIVAVLGPNGAGKSTLIKAIAGLVPITSGRVQLGTQDITATPAHLMVRNGLGFVPQTENVFAGLSVADNLDLAISILKLTKKARLAEIYALFPDLARQRRLMAGLLSGGQRQMLAVARALVASPQVLMLDEPSAGLSPLLVATVFERLVAIKRSGVTIILVEQNARAALAIADQAVILVEGKERLVGAARDLATDPQIAALYLGQAGGGRH